MAKCKEKSGWVGACMNGMGQEGKRERGQDRDRETLFIHGNFIKFTYVVYIGNLLYLKAVWYTNANRTTEYVVKLHNLIG